MTIIVKSQGGGCHTWNSVFCCRPEDEGDSNVMVWICADITSTSCYVFFVQYEALQLWDNTTSPPTLMLYVHADQ